MKRVILAIVSTVASLVLVLSFKTHSPSAAATPPAVISTNTGASTTTTNGSTDSSTASSTKKTAAKKKPASAASVSKTYTGGAADTRYGPVQVQIVVKSGKVTSVAAVEYPMSDPRDAQINSYAIPQLNSEAVSAGSASIDMVSGATYTSDGYISSLQDALNQAGL